MQELINKVKEKGVETGAKFGKEFQESDKDFRNRLTHACAYPEIGFSTKKLANGNWFLTVTKNW